MSMGERGGGAQFEYGISKLVNLFERARVLSLRVINWMHFYVDLVDSVGSIPRPLWWCMLHFCRWAEALALCGSCFLMLVAFGSTPSEPEDWFAFNEEKVHIKVYCMFTRFSKDALNLLSGKQLARVKRWWHLFWFRGLIYALLGAALPVAHCSAGVSFGSLGEVISTIR